ncbi:cytochrome P450 CYP736A12-like [Momordica charantia]|uniref:Cytochrome P450 CYP736A12-like n=1 Tax=Momordica charantia TaxID=3673 RepID=A0A6J1BWX1_MOMCH|nr:cytochrome P450 CYP736A12-like [Momordica charantia]
MPWIWATIALLLLLANYLLQPWLFNSKKLPPGPKGFPILGCLNLLGKFPHRDLQKLSQKYGPIMHMRLGLVNTIVVSSPQAAELFLKTHDLVFASRPLTMVSKFLSYGQKNLVFAQYGSYWRNVRKMCTLELLSNLKINSFKSMRKEELGLLIDRVREKANDGAVVDLSSEVSSLSTDMTCLMVFGRKFSDEEFDDRGFKTMIQEVMQLVAAPNLGDFNIPFVATFDLQGLTRRMKNVSKVFDEFFERIIDEHLKPMGAKRSKDFVDVMLDLMGSEETEYQIDRSSIKAIMLDILGAAMDTSATVIGWALPELIKNPQVMKKVQDELEKVVGLDRMVEESDLVNLEYLDMVIKETLRLYPPVPLLVPHESLEDCVVNDFHIPKKSRVIVNAWAIGRNPSTWTDPEKFYPERFVDSQVDVRGRDFQLIPFGAGRRGCPGIQLGLTVVRLILAQLVHCFDWKLPNDMLSVQLDMTEEFGLTCPRAQDLIVTPIYRIHSDAKFN